MNSITQFITQKLKLKVNETKSAVARPQERKFLGFSFTAGPEVKRVIAPKALDRFKQRIREITRRAQGVSMETTMEELAPYMRGWRSYFGFCETPVALQYLTRWVRLRLRAALWRQWKTPRRRRTALLKLGVRPRLASNTAGSGHGPWRLARESTGRFPPVPKRGDRGHVDDGTSTRSTHYIDGPLCRINCPEEIRLKRAPPPCHSLTVRMR